MTGKPILIVGSISLDTIETISDRRDSILGGSATYATVSAGKSADVHLVGIIGTDFPAEGMKIFEEYSQDLSNLYQKDGQTFSWGGRYPEDWDDRETLFTELGVFTDYEPKLTEKNKNTPVLFLANIHPELQLSVLKQNSKRECVIIDTMNLWIDTERKKLKEVISYCDVLLLNEFEAEQFTRRKNHDDQGAVLQSLGPQQVIIKCGKKGARLYSGHSVDTIGVFPVKNVVDPTGAGDAFGGGLAAAVAHNESMQEAIINGSALASLCIEGFGIESLHNASNEEIDYRKDYLRKTLNS
ncbi:MAG: PfkB family carbohydrate kinase [Candidatus Neomarinimicrobiota bacterium]|nr:PfkB family carbohydrate kinase [Candidatus Neomarinimicrobiota bacterium]MEE3150248.1 PfkB family carbohydrate kinase [Candidatus Neomarinimicrobiota bacterium]